MDELFCTNKCNCHRYCEDFKEIFVELIDSDYGLELIQWITKVIQQRQLHNHYNAACIINLVYLNCIEQMVAGESGIPPLAWDDIETLRAWIRKVSLDTIEFLINIPKLDTRDIKKYNASIYA